MSHGHLLANPIDTNASSSPLSTSSLPFKAFSLPFYAFSLPFNASSLPLTPPHFNLTHFSRPLGPLGRLFASNRRPFNASHCPLMPPCDLLTPLHWPVLLSYRSLTPRHHPFITSSRLTISLWWCLFIKTVLELDYSVKITQKQCIIRTPIRSIYVKIIFDLEINLGIDLLSPKSYFTWISQSVSHEKEILHIFLALFVETYIFSYLILKLTFWSNWSYWRGSSKITKKLPENDFSVKITRKRGITLVSSFIC